MKRYGAVMVVLGVLTAIHAGTGLWRIGVMYQEAQRFGALPFHLTTGLLEEIGLSVLTGLAAWWLLPRGGGAAGWGVRFLVIAWTLALGQIIWVLTMGFLEHGVSWAILLLLFGVGSVSRARSPALAAGAVSGMTVRKVHPALLGGLLFWLLQAPQLFFPYHFTDTKDIWACRVIAFDATGDLSGIFDCLDPGRPPLHSILMWLGHTNASLEGRLLPFLMVGAFGLVLYRLLERVAPALAPWGVLWFFMTVRVYQGAVTSYADVPVMMAIAIGIFLAIDDSIVSHRWQAVMFALIAGAAAALIKRDGAALIIVATGVLWWFLPRRRDPRVYAALAGAMIGFALWSARPESLHTASVFAVNLGVAEAVADTSSLTVQTYTTMFYGMQGQMLSHYGFGMFVPTWIILSVWVWRRRERLPAEARLFTWLAVLGWLAIVGIYVVHVSTGHPYRGSLRVIRTGFGRHLVHMFAFALLSAAAMAEGLVARARARTS